MRRIVLLLAPLCLAACVTPDGYYTPDAPAAAGIIVQATADAEAQSAQATWTSAEVRAAAQATIAAIDVQIAGERATVEAVQARAALEALTPTPAPWPTPTATPDPQATARAQARADYETYGPMVLFGALGLVVAVGLAFLFGAACNRIEGQARADRIRADADADATRIRAEAEAQATVTRAQADAWRASMMQIQPGVNIVSQSPGGVHLLNIGGPAPSPSPAAGELATPAPVGRMVGGKQIEPLDRLAPIDRQAVDYLETCAKLVGWTAQALPPASETADNSERQPIVDRLKARRLIYTRRGRTGGGTYLTGEYKTLQELRDAIAAGAVSLAETT